MESDWQNRARLVCLVLGLTLRLSAAQPGSGPPMPPPPPPAMPKSPAELFRDLLASTPAERTTFLQSKSPKSRELITAKLKEYEALTAEQRELRLRLAQVTFYLSPLLSVSREDRPGRLATVPADVRPLIRDRLAAWDRLPPETQKVVIDNESTLGTFSQLEMVAPSEREGFFSRLPDSERHLVATQYTRWLGLSHSTRQQALKSFGTFFQLSPAEQTRTLNALGPQERRQMDVSLQRFASLSPDQRESCVQAFKRFSDFSPAEQAEFLASAARWEALPPSEREAWRRLVRSMLPLPPMPPLPTMLVGTNQNRRTGEP